MRKTGRKNQKQDIVGTIDEILNFLQTKRKNEKKDRILIDILKDLQKKGVTNLIDVAGMLKYNGKIKYKVNDMVNILLDFDALNQSQNNEYKPHNRRMFTKGSQNVKNIVFTKICFERKDDFLNHLKNYDQMPESVVEQIDNAIENEKLNGFIDMTQSLDENQIDLSETELEICEDWPNTEFLF